MHPQMGRSPINYRTVKFNDDLKLVVFSVQPYIFYNVQATQSGTQPTVFLGTSPGKFKFNHQILEITNDLWDTIIEYGLVTNRNCDATGKCGDVTDKAWNVMNKNGNFNSKHPDIFSQQEQMPSKIGDQSRLYLW